MRHVSSASITLLSEVSGRIALWGGTGLRDWAIKQLCVATLSHHLCKHAVPTCVYQPQVRLRERLDAAAVRGNSTLTDANSPSRMDGGFVQDRKDQQATKDGLKNTCLSLCGVLLGEKEASVGFSKVYFRLDVTRGAQFLFFLEKLSNQPPLLPFSTAETFWTHRLKSYFNEPHNHKMIRSQLHY